MLGCPIGPLDFCNESFRSRVDKIQSSLSALRDLEDSQLETTLLRSCLALRLHFGLVDVRSGYFTRKCTVIMTIAAYLGVKHNYSGGGSEENSAMIFNGKTSRNLRRQDAGSLCAMLSARMQNPSSSYKILKEMQWNTWILKGVCWITAKGCNSYKQRQQVSFSFSLHLNNCYCFHCCYLQYQKMFCRVLESIYHLLM